MNDKILLTKTRTVLQDKMFKIENYNILMEVIKKSNSIYEKDKLINIQYFRNKQLEQRNKYPTTGNFLSSLKNNEFLNKISYIEEFPVALINRRKWENYNRLMDTKNKSCIFFDFFYPQYNLVVELDGQAFHSSKNPIERHELESKDLARDLYCRDELGVTILRLKSFGKSQKSNEAEIKLLERTIKSLQKQKVKPYNYNLKYELYLLEDWKLYYKEELDIIENKIELNYTEKDLYTDKMTTLNVSLNNNITNEEVANLTYLVKLLFNKELNVILY